MLNIRTATKQPTKLIALRPPKSVELSIEQIILSVVKEANSLIFGAGEGPSHFLEIKRSLTQDGRLQIKDYTSPFDLFMDVFKMHLEAAVGTAQSKLAQVITNEERRHRNRFAAAVKVRYGIDVESLMSGTETRKLIENQVRKSVALIKGLSDDLSKQVEFTILDAAQRRQSRTTLSERLRKSLQITRKRARLIAKDQTASFNGALNQARQTQIGIDRYVWETMQDERVRHEHARRHGKTFYWSQPPEDGHPGEPINCRCTAIPLAVQLNYKKDNMTQDAMFEEQEHPRGHGGRFTSKGVSSTHIPWWRRIRPTESQPQSGNSQELMKQAKDVAQRLGFDPSKIRKNTGTLSVQEFKVGDKTFKAAAVAYLNGPLKGMIDINTDNLGSLSIEGVTAHEIMHQKWEVVREEKERQMNELFNKEDDPFDENDNLKPEFAKQYPVYAEMKNLMGFEASKVLKEDDGVTPYSEEYWKEFNETPGKGANSAVHETLAEIARIEIENPDHMNRRLKLKEGTAWGDLYRAINRIYAELQAKRT